MRILDIDDQEVLNPDYEKGYTVEDKILIEKHPATPEVKEQSHLELVAEYPNGGRDYVTVIDVPGIPAKEAWDEYEDIQRYIEYTPEEIAQREKEKGERETEAQRVPNLEKENKLLKEQVNALSSQNDFQEELIVELANIVYA